MAYTKRPLPIGETFNDLTLLEEIPTTENCRRYVYCECKCGSKKTLRYDSVKGGKIKSCGCRISIKSKNQISKMLITRRVNREATIVQNYIGKVYNNLTIKELYKHPKYTSTWFLTECSCGEILPVSLTRMKLGHTKSCGCIRRLKEPIKFTSDIDGEEILVSNEKNQYYRTVKTGLIESKEFIHVHEAKKALKNKNEIWSSNFIVHHIDGDKKNNSSKNLSIFENNKDHKKHHAKLERRMYDFLSQKNLLEEFYEINPDLKLKTIMD